MRTVQINVIALGNYFPFEEAEKKYNSLVGLLQKNGALLVRKDIEYHNSGENPFAVFHYKNTTIDTYNRWNNLSKDQTIGVSITGTNAATAAQSIKELVPWLDYFTQP